MKIVVGVEEIFVGEWLVIRVCIVVYGIVYFGILYVLYGIKGLGGLSEFVVR